MNFQHWLLSGLWILYCVVHSVLANQSLKDKIALRTGSNFKYYRLIYSIFAFVTLTALLWFQFTMSSPWLYTSLISRMVGLILCIPGLTIMIICVNKYFYELSGIQALQKKNPVVHLQQTGLHNHVRHPLYFGTVIFVWGLFIIFPTLANLISCFVITIYVLIGIRLEEKKLHAEFGEAYKEYSKKVPMIIPRF